MKLFDYLMAVFSGIGIVSVLMVATALLNPVSQPAPPPITLTPTVQDGASYTYCFRFDDDTKLQHFAETIKSFNVKAGTCRILKDENYCFDFVSYGGPDLWVEEYARDKCVRIR